MPKVICVTPKAGMEAKAVGAVDVSRFWIPRLQLLEIRTFAQSISSASAVFLALSQSSQCKLDITKYYNRDRFAKNSAS